MNITRSGRMLSLAMLVAAAAMLPGRSQAGDVRIGPRDLSVNVPVVSLKEVRFKRVIKQQYDFSCGSAALATLLSYHYDRPTTEAKVFQAMFAVGDQKAIKQKGFSLLDMKKYLASIGLRADGFRINLDQIAKVHIPGIALINTHGYMHFVVLEGLRNDEVLLGDSALGARVVSRKEFKKMWEGVIFMIRDEIKVAQSNFNKEEDWAVRPSAPFGTALNRQSITGFSLMLRRPDEL